MNSCLKTLATVLLASVAINASAITPADTTSTALPATYSKGRSAMQELTFVGVPLFASGLIATDHKRAFRQDYRNPYPQTRLVSHYHTKWDNYTQYFGPVMMVGLKAAGVEGRSKWGRLLLNNALSYSIMASFVNGIKYTAKVQRPDGSSHNSWPSGHTATSFVGATILHKEYGLTRSPWYSVAGYGVATVTGVMRVLNNRHWASDILSGAGIGIMSAELGYALGDIILGPRGLLRPYMSGLEDIAEHPSYVSLAMGVGFGSPSLDFGQSVRDEATGRTLPLDFSYAASTVLDVEAAFFPLKNIGVGGRLRMKSQPVNGLEDMQVDQRLTVNQEYMTEFIASGGLFGHFPLNQRFAVGAKALVGSSVMQQALVTADDGNSQWQYLSISGHRATSIGAGVSLAYAYRHNTAWRVFCDADFAKRSYELQWQPADGTPMLFDVSKSKLQWVLGAQMMITF